MRIAYLSGAYVPGRSADSVHVMRMCDAMAGLGHEVSLHVRFGPEKALDDHAFYGTKNPFRIYKHVRPAIRGIGALTYGGAVAAHLLVREKPDLIYAREIYALRFSAPLKIPFIFESHWKPKHLVQQRLEASVYALHTFRRVVFISDALRRIYRREFPWLRESSMLVAHDAADVPPTAPASLLPGQGRLQVGYVGGFLPGYGLELIEGLARSLPNVDFHVVGGQDSAIAAWRNRTSTLSNLRFHGFVQPARLGELYAAFEVVIAPFQGTTAHIRWISPMKLFEYMSFGKAIVCSDFPVMREILENERDALLVPPSDLSSWQRALDRLHDPSLRATLGRAALEKLMQRHTWQNRARAVLAGVG